jgi:parallel beta helix pectate lyase-like protein
MIIMQESTFGCYTDQQISCESTNFRKKIIQEKKIMKLKTRILICTGCLLLCLLFSVNAEELVMFNYQGRVKVQGFAFDGNGQFKFAIINNNGSKTLWSNDLSSIDGGEPFNHIEIAVINGVFDTMIGDPDLGMEAINSSVFNHPNKIRLRIWFNDGTHGFQRLLPDKRIVNPELMGIRTGTDDFTIYVNGTTGDDENSGLTTDTAKRTIQAAIDVLPATIRCGVTISISEGIYMESVKIQNVILSGTKASFRIYGNPANPSSVRITGEDETTTPNSIKYEDGISIIDQQQEILLEGFQVDSYNNYAIAFIRSNAVMKNIIVKKAGFGGIDVQGPGWIKVENCLVTECVRGISSGGSARLHIFDSEIFDITTHGIISQSGSNNLVDNTIIYQCGGSGIGVFNSANLYAKLCKIYNCGTSNYYYATESEANSYLRLMGNEIYSNTIGGVRVSQNSYAYFYSSPTIIRDNPVGISAESSSTLHNREGTNINFSDNNTNITEANGGIYITSYH